MITTHQILRKGTSILLGIGLDNAVLDILTDAAQVRECLQAFQEPILGLTSIRMGTFGVYPVTLNLHHDGTVSIVIDGPDFDNCRNQAAGIWPNTEDLRRLLAEAVER